MDKRKSGDLGQVFCGLEQGWVRPLSFTGAFVRPPMT